jgi:hypothetical protein
MAKSQVKVSVKVVPTRGESKEVKVAISKGGDTVGTALKKLKLGGRVDITVDGEPASAETRITSRSKVTITERPQGS